MREMGERVSFHFPMFSPSPAMSTTYIFLPSVVPRAPNLMAGPSVPPIEHGCEGRYLPRDNPESSEPEDSLSDDESDADAPAADLGDPVEDPATSRKKGSFYTDRKGNFYMLEWANFAEFDEWRRAEEAANTIEFQGSSVWHSPGLWSCRRLFVCGCKLTGGRNKTEQKSKRKCKIESKKIRCPCRVVIKIYPHTTVILGSYKKAHNHETGAANIKYMGISHETREHMKALLGERVDRWQVVRKYYLVLF